VPAREVTHEARFFGTNRHTVDPISSGYGVRLAPLQVDVDRHSALATDQVRVRCRLRGDGAVLQTGTIRTITMA